MAPSMFQRAMILPFSSVCQCIRAQWQWNASETKNREIGKQQRTNEFVREMERRKLQFSVANERLCSHAVREALMCVWHPGPGHCSRSTQLKYVRQTINSLQLLSVNHLSQSWVSCLCLLGKWLQTSNTCPMTDCQATARQTVAAERRKRCSINNSFFYLSMKFVKFSRNILNGITFAFVFLSPKFRKSIFKFVALNDASNGSAMSQSGERKKCVYLVL